MLLFLLSWYAALDSTVYTRTRLFKYCSSVHFRVYDNPRPRFELTCTKEYIFFIQVHSPLSIVHSRSHQNVSLTTFYAYANEYMS